MVLLNVYAIVIVVVCLPLRVQINYRSVMHEMGACYLSPEYSNVVDLLKEYGVDGQYAVSLQLRVHVPLR